MSINPLLKKGRVIKDVIFGLIAFTDIECAWMDTCEYQSLRSCKQLSVVHLVFPGATHTRFEHSLEACHLAGQLLNQIAINHGEEKVMTARDVQLIRLAMLLHDLGHSMNSHTCCKMLKKCFPNIVPEMLDHELRGILLIKHMWKKYREKFDKYFAISEDEIDFICAAIRGYPSSEDQVERYPGFLWQVVANHTNELDCDKVYLLCDAFMCGKEWKLEFDLIFASARISPDGNHIVYSEKVAPLIKEIFERRHKMYESVYCHDKVLLIEAQMMEVMELLFRVNKWDELLNNYAANDHAWRLVLNDSALSDIYKRKHQAQLYMPLNSQEEKWMADCIELYERLQNRSLYKMISSKRSGEKGEGKLEPREEEQKITLAYSNSSFNPLDKILCYSKQNKFILTPLSQCNPSTVHAHNHSETKLIKYCK